MSPIGQSPKARPRLLHGHRRPRGDDHRDDDDDPIVLITRFAAVWIRVCLLDVQCFLLRGVGLQACTCTNLSCLGA